MKITACTHNTNSVHAAREHVDTQTTLHSGLICVLAPCKLFVVVKTKIQLTNRVAVHVACSILI